MQNKSINKLFITWAAITLIASLGFICLVIKGLPLNSNILDLLPQSSSLSTSTQSASKQFADTISRRFIILVGSKDKIQAQQAADMLVSKLENTKSIDKINAKISLDEKNAWVQLYFSHRLSFLTDTNKQLLQNNNTQAIIDSALSNIYSPMGIVNDDLLKTDPYFLFIDYIKHHFASNSKVELDNNYSMLHDGQNWYVMVQGDLNGNSFSLNQQADFTNSVSEAQSAIKTVYSDIQFLKTGMVFFAKAGADGAQHDISTIGLGSLIGIILLILITFRSFSPLIYTILSVLVGFTSAFFVTYLVFGSVFLFTLVFGASLIGICVDYAFFYYSERLYAGENWDPKEGLKRILPGISLGLLNVVLAFLIIAISPFPGLRQLVLFAAVGLSMAFFTVVALFPVLLKSKPKKTRTISWLKSYINFWQFLSWKKLGLLYSILIIFIFIGLSQLSIDDNVRHLEQMPEVLKNQKNKINLLTGSTMGTDYLIIQGNSPESMLEHTELATQAIEQVNPDLPHPTLSLVNFLPSIETQKENYHLIKTKLFGHHLIDYLQQIGVSDEQAKLISDDLNALKFEPITLDTWYSSSASKYLRFLSLGENDSQNYFSAVMLSEQADKVYIKDLASKYDYINYINNADDISSIFKSYRQIISVLLILIFSVLILFLTLKYGLKRAIIYFIPPFISCLLGIAVLGFLNVSLTLFNLLALILVLGIAVDYVLFFAESKQAENYHYQPTLLAVLLSAITTTLSFGLLALSSTAVVQDFGITVFVGIVSAFILAPLAMKINYEDIPKRLK